MVHICEFKWKAAELNIRKKKKRQRRKGHHLAKSTRDTPRRERKGLWSPFIEFHWLSPLSSWNIDAELYLKWTLDERLQQEQDTRAVEKTSSLLLQSAGRGLSEAEFYSQSVQWGRSLHTSALLARCCHLIVLIACCHGTAYVFFLSFPCNDLTSPRASQTWS